MATHDFPPVLDVRRVAEGADRLQGETSLSSFVRLADQFGAQAQHLKLVWLAEFSLRSSAEMPPQAWLRLSIHGRLPLICQRCLGEMQAPVDVNREFRFVASEALAQEQDDASAEDLLVSSRQFDLAQLIEDEVILDLPLLPRHEQCPHPVPLSVADADFVQEPERQSPFAALQGLKQDKPH